MEKLLGLINGAAGVLLVMCAQTHLDNYLHGNCGNYNKPQRQFQQTLIYYLLYNKICCNLGSTLFLMFDGCNSKSGRQMSEQSKRGTLQWHHINHSTRRSQLSASITTNLLLGPPPAHNPSHGIPETT
jgi:hypothetical protein